MSTKSTTTVPSRPDPASTPGIRHDANAGTQPPAVSREPLVSARDLSVGYGDQPVCAPATFDLLPGQVLALVGVNGAGKSTILRTCCGLLRPLSGRYTYSDTSRIPAQAPSAPPSPRIWGRSPSSPP